MFPEPLFLLLLGPFHPEKRFYCAGLVVTHFIYLRNTTVI